MSPLPRISPSILASWNRKLQTLSGRQIGRLVRRAGLLKTPEDERDFRIPLLGHSLKTEKSGSIGVLSMVLFLPPASKGGKANLAAIRSLGLSESDACHWASACRRVCLDSSGQNGLPDAIAGRARKIAFLARNPLLFLARLARDLHSLERRARKLGMTPAVRLNGTSDFRFDRLMLASTWKGIRWYDYTKRPNPIPADPSWHYTYSYSETSDPATVRKTLEGGINVAVVYSSRELRDRAVQEGQRVDGRRFRVIDGDETDARFLDPKGVVVGLYAKDRTGGAEDDSGFVRHSLAPIGGILRMAAGG